MTIKDTILTQKSPTLLFTVSCEREENHTFACEKKLNPGLGLRPFHLSPQTHEYIGKGDYLQKSLLISAYPDFSLACLLIPLITVVVWFFFAGR